MNLGRWTWQARLRERTICKLLGHHPRLEKITGRAHGFARLDGVRVYCGRCGVTISSQVKRAPLPR